MICRLAEYFLSYDRFTENGSGSSIGPCIISPFKVHALAKGGGVHK